MKQLDMFDMMLPTFKFEKDKPIRVVELFSGIGFQAMGIKLAEIPYEVVATSEIDKYAIASYEAIHGHNPNLGSITDIQGIDMPKEVDLMTYSFPCTDLSKAGKQKGLDNTRSGLVYEVLRLLQQMKELDNLPKVLIMENVVDLVQQKFINQFNEIQQELESLGYTNYTQTLNAKNYGIAQNRDRVFMVSILGEYNYNFPQPFDLTHRLKDYLEDAVDEKYYLSDKMMNFFINNSKANELKGNGFRFTPSDGNGHAKCITTNSGSRMDDNFIKIPEMTQKGYKEAYDGDGVYLDRPHQKRGVVQSGMIQTLKTSGNDVGVVVEDFYKNREPRYYEGVSPTIRAERQGLKVVATAQRGRENVQQLEVSDREYANALTTVQKDSMIGIKEKKLRIRKLTPTETGRLMGMNDEQINKQLEVVSNSQAYKQHGNGIVAQVIGLIIGMMVYEDEQELINVVMNNSHDWLNRKM